MEKKINYRLGLDIGIASVGWGLVDENDNIIDAGVRLFPEGGINKKTAAERRTKRGARRLLRRRMHRNERARKLFYDFKLISSIEEDLYLSQITPYELRVKGLKEELTSRELAVSLLHLVKRRGIHNFEIKLSSGGKKDEEAEGTKVILVKNSQELGEKYVCELQLERLNNSENNVHNGNVRGKNNIFRTEEYAREAKAILQEQKKYNAKITDEFIRKYICILEGRREYFQGPGKVLKINGVEKNVSPYGWLNEEDWIEKLFGRCTYFPDEIRMVKNSYTAELFNLLNDLNNLTIKRAENEKLTKDEKEQIIKLAKEQKVGLTLGKISKLLKVIDMDISGYRIDKNEKAVFTPLKTYVEINKITGIEDRESIDEIARILTIFQSKDKIKENLKENLKKNIKMEDEQIVDALSDLAGYTGSHSLSKKAMELILDELLESGKNQMELYTEKGLSPVRMDFTNSKELPKEYVSEWILSPVTKRALTQTINVVNAIHKKYGIPSEVVIEMARERNSDEKRDLIKELQKKNEKTNKLVKELLAGSKMGKGTFEKLKFFIAQKAECMYSGDIIQVENLIKYPENYEVDHIIPRSISFDDSESNKVLVKRKENQEKINRTPYEYLSTVGRYEEYKARVLNMYKNKIINKKKLEYLLFEGDLDKYATKFIARNLVDTRYAIREFMTLLRKFYVDKKLDVKIKSIRGSVTSQMRKEWSFKKEREISHNHHAQDALIILFGEKLLYNALPYVRTYNLQGEESKVDIRTGEILKEEEYRKLFGYKYGEMIKEYDRFRYSHYVDKKPNRQLSDETIFSTRIVKEITMKGKKEVIVEKEYVINKLSGIYEKNNKKIKDFFGSEKKQQQLLMYHNDPKTFAKIMEIYRTYSKEPNPFYSYKEEHRKYITKYAKKDNGPPIFDIKYRESELGNCLDISHKYNSKDKKVVMLSLPSIRADLYKKDDLYKFITVSYLMLEDKGNFYEVNMNKYNGDRERKGIDSGYEFQCSLYTGDIFEYTTEKTNEKFKFKGVNDDKDNKFEVDYIDKFNSQVIESIKGLKDILKNEIRINIIERLQQVIGNKFSKEEAIDYIEKYPVSSNQKILTVGKKTKKIRKINTNNLGVEYDSVEKFISRMYK